MEMGGVEEEQVVEEIIPSTWQVPFFG